MERLQFERGYYTGERALFGTRCADFVECIFDDGESPLKHSSDLELRFSSFRWKYPLWYSKDVRLTNCTLAPTARAGIWYTDDVSLSDCLIEAPKTFRRGRGISLQKVNLTDAAETFWWCRDVKLSDVQARGDYFCMNCVGVTADELKLVGNYPFDGAENVRIKNSALISKDAFWNCSNVTVEDSYICGEYLAWNSKNVSFIGCTIESLQGLCYVDELYMRDCRLVNTTLAFEYSKLDVEISGAIDSVIDPSEGVIKADKIGELIIHRDRVDPDRTRVILG